MPSVLQSWSAFWLSSRSGDGCTPSSTIIPDFLSSEYSTRLPSEYDDMYQLTPSYAIELDKRQVCLMFIHDSEYYRNATHKTCYLVIIMKYLKNLLIIWQIGKKLHNSGSWPPFYTLSISEEFWLIWLLSSCYHQCIIDYIDRHMRLELSRMGRQVLSK